MSRATPPRLVEGIDYYMDGSKFVFMAAYHLKRGYCCNSRCRHCPYERDSVPRVPITAGSPAGVAIQLLGVSLKRPVTGG